MLSTTHRVISLWQPWASLFAAGIKQYETRSWPTQWRGLVFVHAGKFQDDETQTAAWSFRAHFHKAGLSAQDEKWAYLLPRGAVIGAVRIVDCTSTVDLIEQERISEVEQTMGNYTPDRYGWKVTHAVMFKQPVVCRGMQGLYTLTGPTLDECMAALEASTNPVHVQALLEVSPVRDVVHA